MCPDGKLTKTKFVDLYRKIFPEGKSAAFYQHMFRALDTDRSGSLEFPEFIQVRDSASKIGSYLEAENV